ncbi:regulatory inactivation of DnaA Hda protein [Arboricoccus pini]|uniref:Regulatory inactivation of DnaA Hda protein n=1 Tax=Arboricoccus pini TaxID=1963835 RepID=A0A212Q876_9PROT|nr:DnaA/Hda family protein [Arboricoccus pini]SNB55571.1 regulatory inactivation of DnaA Hda protein [Arboricoccus pini]
MKIDADQLALDLPHLEGSELADFLPAASNREALNAILVWPDWPATALLLAGPEGAGKTHLARIWAKRAGAVILGAADLWEAAGPLGRLGRRQAAVVDGADDITDEATLFHLYNALAERQGHLLLTGSRPLAEWPIRLPDLRSRLRTAWHVRIDPPCDALLAALLIKQFADRQLRVDPGVVDYLVSRMERSFPAVRLLVTALDRASLRARRPIRLTLARDVLAMLRDEATAAPADHAPEEFELIGR